MVTDISASGDIKSSRVKKGEIFCKRKGDTHFPRKI